MKQHLYNRIEWPTLLLFTIMYALWFALIVFHAQLPLYVVIPTLCFLVALHSSLQHEVIHGHPTPSTKLNTLFAFPAVGLFVPFERYELLHLQHHRNWLITDPYDDSESYFLAKSQWYSCNGVIRAILNFNNTLVGRLLIGPAVMLVRMCASEFAQFKNTDVLFSWLKHLFGIALVLVFLRWANFSIVFYVLAIAYPATSLLMLRAFSEHLPEEDPELRSAIIKSNVVMRLLYLNNNLHRVHHDHPEVAWYALPELYRQQYTQHSVHVYPGYFYLMKKFAFTKRFPVQHPFLPMQSDNSKAQTK